MEQLDLCRTEEGPVRPLSLALWRLHVQKSPPRDAQTSEIDLTLDNGETNIETFQEAENYTLAVGKTSAGSVLNSCREGMDCDRKKKGKGRD